MIVKDETPVLERLFRSVRNVIDYFVIVDTGSRDGTPEFIERLAREFGLPGEVHFRDWVDFGHNRQEALELAVAAGQGDWLLLIDADEELTYSNPEFFLRLEPGITYRLAKHLNNLHYSLDNLIDIRENRWAWRSPVHEYLEHLEGPGRKENREDVWIVCHSGQGARSRGITPREKFLRDAALLEAALHQEPDNPRNHFYLAQSYRDGGEPAKAYKHYDRRVELGGWPEEVYVAQCEKAKLAIQLLHPYPNIVTQHLKAWSLRPTRAEALWQLAAYCREQQRYAEGYLFAKVGKDIPLSDDILFVQRDVHEWRLLDEFAICAYWIGQYEESVEAGQRLLAEAAFPPGEASRLKTNLDFALAKL
jgi:glycosyltransferase involved in cell wall biosynthesis